MNRSEPELFRGWKAAQPPDGMGARVLAAARTEKRSERREYLVDRLWESRTLRLGWSAAASLLLLVNLVVMTSPTPAPRVADARCADVLDSDPIVVALLERGAESTRAKLAEQTELLNALLAVGSAADTTSEKMEI